MGRTITQQFSLYNTVGLVDKEKKVYYVPHKDLLYNQRDPLGIMSRVCDCYYKLFNTVSPFSSLYHNVEISQWSPEDRELVIEGTIDDFRQSRGKGLALNYIIVSRIVKEDDEPILQANRYYYAFFIDSVEQRGSRSVYLSLTPDYFTNFFYFNNQEEVTIDYDPFNPVMKNCFIERQHYDRFTLNEDDELVYTNLRRILGSEESFRYKYQYKNERLFLPVGVNLNLSDYETFCNSLKAINSKASFLTFVSSLTDREIKWLSQLFVSYLNVIFKENILAPMGYKNTDSTLKLYYRAGYNTYKGVAVPYSHIVVPFVSIPKGFENIQKNWIKLSYFFYKIGAYENPIYSKIYDVVGDDNYSPSHVLQYLTNIGASIHILTSFVSKYSPINNNVIGVRNETDNIRIDYATDPTQSKSLPMGSVSVATQTITLDHTSMALLPFTYPEGSGNFVKYVLDDSLGYYSDDPNNTQAISYLFSYDTDSGLFAFNTSACWFSEKSQPLSDPRPADLRNLVFVLGESEVQEMNLILRDRVINLDEYIDPLLESDPYSFYSVSVNEVEQIISKMKLIESYDEDTVSFNMKYKPILSYNDSYKIGLVPSYYIGEKWERYYSEAIITISSSEVPVRDDSWLNYYITNKAQMKNQFAVQYNNFESGLTQGVLNMVTDTAVGGLKGESMGGNGQVGALTGTIKGFTNIMNTVISNKYQVANIELTQKAKMSDMGAKPDTVKFAGSDILYDMIQNERGFYLNYYRIDEVSYNSACKYLERFGYLVNIYDTINAYDRIGLNYVKVNSFDFVEDNFVLSTEQMNAISEIFANGVTLLHDKNFLHNLGEIVSNVNYHNYEYALRNNI